MEKLKPTHDHKLTDIIKVGIFALMLLLPFLVFLPNAFYYGFNEHAVVGQEETYYNFYQNIPNGKPINLDIIRVYNSEFELMNNRCVIDENGYLYVPTDSESAYVYFDTPQHPIFSQGNFIYTTYTIYADNPIDYEVYIGDEDIKLNPNDLSLPTIPTKKSFITNINLGSDLEQYNVFFKITDGSNDFYIKDVMIFDLTTIFGSGNEPTKDVFESYLTQDYYKFGDNYVLKDKGTNITWSMYNGWEDIWQTPLFSWTNNSILNTGLVAFTNVFGITKTSYITNLITYELIIVSIYIVLDIVLTLFKWLTHIGQKE